MVSSSANHRRQFCWINHKDTENTVGSSLCPLCLCSWCHHSLFTTTLFPFAFLPRPRPSHRPAQGGGGSSPKALSGALTTTADYDGYDLTSNPMDAQPRDLYRYITADGSAPFTDWLEALRDERAIVKVKVRLERVRLGNLGDHRSVGAAVWELKIDYGPGYRVYFGQTDTSTILLLWGGDKRTQNQDIQRAKEYWDDYTKRDNASERLVP